MKQTLYPDPKTLADVMALIQVLAQTADDTVRSESGLTGVLQGKPRSEDTPTWIDLAQNHPEFFRVRTDEEKSARVSLISSTFLLRMSEGNAWHCPQKILRGS